jgi:uncharacterized membrane protein
MHGIERKKERNQKNKTKTHTIITSIDGFETLAELRVTFWKFWLSLSLLSSLLEDVSLVL